MQEIFAENSGKIEEGEDSVIIFSGGSIDILCAIKLLDAHKNAVLIAADKGIETMAEMNLMPDFIIGDFDSASEDAVNIINNLHEVYHIPVERLIPEKDDTDTEDAVKLALSHTKGDIYILGGTGTRIDHVLGNIAVLGMGHDAHRRIILQDSHNRIELLFEDTVIKKEELFGKYISFFPFGDRVEGLTLEGFKYPLKNYSFGGFNSLGVSNELAAEEGHISFNSGVLIMVQSKD